jgi:hypothetical protein
MAQTYDVDFSSQGETISGTILLADGTTGSVANSDIDSFSLSGTGPVIFSYAAASDSGTGGGALEVANGDLYFNPPPWYLGQTGDLIMQSAYNGFGPLTFCGGGCPAGGSGRTSGPGMIVYGGGKTGIFSLADGLLLGTDPPASAPEIDPAGAMGGVTLLLGALAVMRGRRRIPRSYR